MISPNCPVNMEVTSTTSSYNTIERNAHREPMRSNVSDRTDGLSENELLEEVNQDAEDEDTLSDDSMRLRLSDDEADASQPGAPNELNASCSSSEQTSSQDTAMGLTDFDEKVLFNNDTKSSVNKSCRFGSNKEIQRLKQRKQILNETLVGGKKHTNSMWRGGNRREHSSNNTIQSTKRCLRGHSLRVRHNYGHSNVHKIPSYFNNHDNFGRPPNHYRRYGSNWNYSKARYLHDSARNMQRNAVKGQPLDPKSESHSDAEIELLKSNQSPAHLPESFRRTSFNSIDNDGSTTRQETIKPWSANENSEKTLIANVKKSNDSLPSIHDELSKECIHLNLDQESNPDSKTCENFNSIQSNWKDCKQVSSYSYDSKFTSDDWFDDSHPTNDTNIRCIETSFPLLSQDSSDFKGVGSALPVRDTEFAVPLKQKTEMAIGDAPAPRDSNLDSLDVAMQRTESDIDHKTNDAKIDNDNEIDLPSGIRKEPDTDGLVHDETKESNTIVDALVSSQGYESHIISSKLCATVDRAEVMDMLTDQPNHAEETNAANVKDPQDNADQELKPCNKDNVEHEEKLENEQTHSSTPDANQVTEQSIEVVIESKELSEHTDNQCEKIVSDDIENESDAAKPIKIAKSVLKKPRLFKKIDEIESLRLGCGKTSVQPSDNSRRNSTEKVTSKPVSDEEMQPILVMKRSLPDPESVIDQFFHKKIKITPDSDSGVFPEQSKDETMTDSPCENKKTNTGGKCEEIPKPLHYVRRFFQRDMKGRMSKLKREELEELIIQKLVETITMRGEIGRLREQARISERNQEATRIRCQQLSKQIKDFDMVLSRNTVDRRSNNDKPVPPIKINRSVGLQVNFVTDQGIQSLRGLSANNTVKTIAPSPVTLNGANTKTVPPKVSNTTPVPRRGIKVRSPRRAEVPKNPSVVVQPQTSTATPAALVVSKSADTSRNLSILNNSKEQVLPNAIPAQSAAAKVQSIVINGKISNQVNRQTALQNNQKPGSNDLIDLTEEEDKNRSTSSSTSNVLPMVGTVTSSIATKTPHPRFQRVSQATLPGNVAVTTQPANIRVVQSVPQPTPTALVNNINATRMAYVMQGTPTAGRQLLIAPNPNQIRPATSTARGQYSNMTYKPGISTLSNGTVRVMTTTASTIPYAQTPPAPLPDTPPYPTKIGLKLPPPPPSLKISKVAQGIVLSWNMAQSENHADIASYQLYAYQEIPGTPPHSNLWKKVGDVRALPLPMACTLKEFTPGNNYHFAVRAVDTHSRLGKYSVPRNISL